MHAMMIDRCIMLTLSGSLMNFLLDAVILVCLFAADGEMEVREEEQMTGRG